MNSHPTKVFPIFLPKLGYLLLEPQKGYKIMNKSVTGYMVNNFWFKLNSINKNTQTKYVINSKELHFIFEKN